MDKKKVLLFTDSFPFGYKEAFLEAEIIELGNNNDIELIIFPLLENSLPQREVPANAVFDIKLCDKLKFYEKWIFLLFPVIFLNPFFWKEIKVFSSVIFKLKKLRKLIAASTFSWVIYKYLKKNYSEELNSKSIFYSYWFYYAAYAGALLKRDNFDFTLISRAHGTDVFQNRKDTGCYLPFRRFPLWQYFSKIFPVSQEGKRYLNQNQNIPFSKLEVSYLGINPPNAISLGSMKNSLTVVSCSNIISIKRIDLIIDGLASYKECYPSNEIIWHHFGDGTLLTQIKKLANEKLVPKDINYKFHGHVQNHEVIKFYSNTDLDCFITTSSTEGLPVSIMEALCFGIPVLATAVGGIPEAMNDELGFLLDKKFTNSDFVFGLHKMHEFKTLEKREKIALFGKQKFTAEINYGRFIDNILQ
ncbi:MAG: glycosyltransferase [Bacteroidales bacterium]|nr:glycosyltransferase [Bacteroidales bacterium]